MTPQKPGPKPGPESRKERTGEDWKVFKCNLTPKQHKFIMSQGILSGAQYVRLTIDMVMIWAEDPELLDKYDLEPEFVRKNLIITEEFLDHIRKKIIEGN